MQRIADALAGLVPELALVATSPYVRARETAEILADALPRGGRCSPEGAELAPAAGAPRSSSSSRAQQALAAIACVGHEPNLSPPRRLSAHGQRSARCSSCSKGGRRLLDFTGARRRRAAPSCSGTSPRPSCGRSLTVRTRDRRSARDLPADLLDRPAEEAVRRLALASSSARRRRARALVDGDDPEALHDFRVALRRLRSLLRALPRRASRRVAASRPLAARRDRRATPTPGATPRWRLAWLDTLRRGSQARRAAPGTECAPRAASPRAATRLSQARARDRARLRRARRRPAGRLVAYTVTVHLDGDPRRRRASRPRRARSRAQPRRALGSAGAASRPSRRDRRACGAHRRQAPALPARAARALDRRARAARSRRSGAAGSPRRAPRPAAPRRPRSPSRWRRSSRSAPSG